MRWANRKDASEKPIVDALEKAGAMVWRIQHPADLLVFYQKRWTVLECKTPKANGEFRKRTDQPKQDAFLAETGVPKVRTPEEALMAVGAVDASDTDKYLRENI
jgi:hypothetical protein